MKWRPLLNKAIIKVEKSSEKKGKIYMTEASRKANDFGILEHLGRCADEKQYDFLKNYIGQKVYFAKGEAEELGKEKDITWFGVSVYNINYYED